MSSTWGDRVKISVFGESHSEGIGVVIDGLPAGEKIDPDMVLLQMERRAPGGHKTSTPRKEKDTPEILSGLLNGLTTGTPLAAVIRNTNTRSQDYNNLLSCPRPGHGDYTGHVKYGGHEDIRGGGHFSGRLTAPIVFAGAVARQILSGRGVEIGAHALEIAGVRDSELDSVNVDAQLLKKLSGEYFSVINPSVKERMEQEIEAARLQGDSVGGVIECAAVGVQPGLGTPMFGGVENLFASILFGIPGVKGVEFGAGFGSSSMRGSQNNDEFYFQDGIKTRTNNAGGILGGITSGMPIVFKMAVKPTPSISMPQQSVNLQTGKAQELIVKGRHDPCIVPRAIPVAEAAAALALIQII